MPLDSASLSSTRHARVAQLNAQARLQSGEEIILAALQEAPNMALVSSFGAESAVLLHLVAQVKPDLPILFLDTELLFRQTLTYQQDLTEWLGLAQVTILRSGHLSKRDTDGTLHQRDPDACCALRKTEPLHSALRGFDGWLTGRKRFQSGARATLDPFEVEEPGNAPARLKVNPLANWSTQQVAGYMQDHQLPRHPLVAQGYPSIGCTPCTTTVRPGEDPRAGRWKDTDKQECGIHFANGKATRNGASI